MSENLSEKAQKSMEETKEQELINPQEPEVIEKEAAAVGKVVVQAIKEEFSGPIPPRYY